MVNPSTVLENVDNEELTFKIKTVSTISKRVFYRLDRSVSRVTHRSRYKKYTSEEFQSRFEHIRDGIFGCFSVFNRGRVFLGFLYYTSSNLLK